jgi:hypothetical protein
MSKETQVTKSIQHATKPPMSSRFVAITYLIYIVFWQAMVLGGFGYVVFGLDKSGWWMLFAVFLSASAYNPENWKQLLNDF